MEGIGGALDEPAPTSGSGDFAKPQSRNPKLPNQKNNVDAAAPPPSLLGQWVQSRDGERISEYEIYLEGDVLRIKSLWLASGYIHGELGPVTIDGNGVLNYIEDYGNYKSRIRLVIKDEFTLNGTQEGPSSSLVTNYEMKKKETKGIGDSRAYLAKQFGSKEKAEVIAHSLDQAILTLRTALESFDRALLDPKFKKDVDEQIRPYFSVSGEIHEMIYKSYQSRIQKTLEQLLMKQKSPGRYFRNPAVYPCRDILKRAKTSGRAFVGLDDPLKQIFLKKAFFADSQKEKTCTIIHEESHFSALAGDIPLFGKDKDYYGEWIAKRLPPPKAFADADSFAYLVYNIAENALK